MEPKIESTTDPESILPKNKKAKPAEVKPQRPAKQSSMKKLDDESIRLLESLKEKANKKNYGRKVRDSEILNLALKLVTADHLEKLKETTLSEQDRLKIAHETYQKAHGKITFDQFIGKLLRGELKTASGHAGEL